MPFHMNGQQGFLHDILGVDPALNDLAPDEAANEGSYPAKKVGISLFISRDRGPEQPGELGFVLAGHKSSPPMFASRPWFVTWPTK